MCDYDDVNRDLRIVKGDDGNLCLQICKDRTCTNVEKIDKNAVRFKTDCCTIYTGNADIVSHISSQSKQKFYKQGEGKVMKKHYHHSMYSPVIAEETSYKDEHFFKGQP